MRGKSQKSTKNNCPFCLAEAHNQARVLSYSKHSISLLSNPRLMKGHSLVTPKRHVEYPGDLSSDELIDIFDNIEKIRTKLLDNGLGTGVDVRQNFRPFLPESRLKIDHVHFHVLPRTFKDEIYQKAMHYETELFEDLSDDEFNELSKLLID